MTMLAHSLAFLAVLVAPVPAAGTLRGGHNSPHVIMDSGDAAPLMTHKCKHDLVTAQCKCTCNYA